MLRAMSGRSFLGFGLIRPFVRDQKGDFAAAEAEVLVRACVGQVLGTRGRNAKSEGEMPWRTDFGSLLFTLRHAPNDPVTQALAKTYISDALGAWEKRVRVRALSFRTEKSRTDLKGGDDVLVASLVYDLVDGGTIIQTNIQQDVRL